jgi:phosphatidylinositol glycan class S
MPTLHRLSLLHNFTVESQIRYQSPLAFIPQAINTTDGVEYGLTPSELTIFVNSADWSLCEPCSAVSTIYGLTHQPFI